MPWLDQLAEDEDDILVERQVHHVPEHFIVKSAEELGRKRTGVIEIWIEAVSGGYGKAALVA